MTPRLNHEMLLPKLHDEFLCEFVVVWATESERMAVRWDRVIAVSDFSSCPADRPGRVMLDCVPGRWYELCHDNQQISIFERLNNASEWRRDIRNNGVGEWSRRESLKNW